MNRKSITFSSRMNTPCEKTIAAYIGFIGNDLFLFETNVQNQTRLQFLLDVNDASIPADKLAEAKEAKSLAFNQIKVYNHPSFIEYYHVVNNTRLKKQAFWVKRPELKVAA